MVKHTAALRKLSWILSLAFLLGWSAPNAKAIGYTYTFSFTTGDLLNALQAGIGPNEQQFALFAVFVQPTNITQPYTYTVAYSPKPGTSATDAWMTAFISDPINLGPGQFVQFSKYPTQTNVTVINDSSPNIFLGQSFKDDGIAIPFDFGCAGPLPCTTGNPSLLDALMSPSAKFMITLTTTQYLTQLDLAGQASGIHAANPGEFDPARDKTASGIPFELVANTPEPGTMLLVGLGAAGLFWRARKRAVTPRP